MGEQRGGTALIHSRARPKLVSLRLLRPEPAGLAARKRIKKNDVGASLSESRRPRLLGADTQPLRKEKKTQKQKNNPARALCCCGCVQPNVDKTSRSNNYRCGAVSAS